jgi:hypothetical protein
VGHGRRRRQAHDRRHVWIRVRRGLCHHCHRTLTVLPAGCVPGASYSLTARRDAMGCLEAGLPLEQAAPDCLDPDRVVDPSTLRRWARRRLESLRLCAASRWASFLCPPTLLAWDFRAGFRMLVVEASPP